MDLLICEPPLDNSFQKDKLELVNKGSQGRRRKPSRSNLKLLLSPIVRFDQEISTEIIKKVLVNGNHVISQTSTPINKYQSTNGRLSPEDLDENCNSLRNFTNKNIISNCEIHESQANIAIDNCNTVQEISVCNSVEEKSLLIQKNVHENRNIVNSIESSFSTARSVLAEHFANRLKLVKQSGGSEKRNIDLSLKSQLSKEVVLDCVVLKLDSNSATKCTTKGIKSNGENYNGIFKNQHLKKVITNNVELGLVNNHCNGLTENVKKNVESFHGIFESRSSKKVIINGVKSKPESGLITNFNNKDVWYISNNNLLTQENSGNNEVANKNVNNIVNRQFLKNSLSVNGSSDGIKIQYQNSEFRPFLKIAPVTPQSSNDAHQFTIEAKLKRKKLESSTSAVLIQTWERRTQKDFPCKTKSDHRLQDKENIQKSSHVMPDTYTKYKQNVIPLQRCKSMSRIQDAEETVLCQLSENRWRSGQAISTAHETNQEPEWISISRKLRAKYVEPEPTESKETKLPMRTYQDPTPHPRQRNPNNQKTMVPMVPSKEPENVDGEPPWIHLSRKLCNKFIEEHIEYPENGKEVKAAEPTVDVRIIETVGRRPKTKMRKEGEPEWVSLSRKLRAKFIETHIDDPDTMSLDNQLNASDPEDTSSESFSEASQEMTCVRKNSKTNNDTNGYMCKPEEKEDKENDRFNLKYSYDRQHSMPSLDKDNSWEYQEMDFDQESNSGTFQEFEFEDALPDSDRNSVKPAKVLDVRENSEPFDSLEYRSFEKRYGKHSEDTNGAHSQFVNNNMDCFNRDVKFAPREEEITKKSITVQFISPKKKMAEKSVRNNNQSATVSSKGTVPENHNYQKYNRFRTTNNHVDQVSTNFNKRNNNIDSTNFSPVFGISFSCKDNIPKEDDKSNTMIENKDVLNEKPAIASATSTNNQKSSKIEKTAECDFESIPRKSTDSGTFFNLTTWEEAHYVAVDKASGSSNQKFKNNIGKSKNERFKIKEDTHVAPKAKKTVQQELNCTCNQMQLNYLKKVRELEKSFPEFENDTTVDKLENKNSDYSKIQKKSMTTEEKSKAIETTLIEDINFESFGFESDLSDSNDNIESNTDFSRDLVSKSADDKEKIINKKVETQVCSNENLYRPTIISENDNVDDIDNEKGVKKICNNSSNRDSKNHGGCNGYLPNYSNVKKFHKIVQTDDIPSLNRTDFHRPFHSEDSKTKSSNSINEYANIQSQFTDNDTHCDSDVSNFNERTKFSHSISSETEKENIPTTDKEPHKTNRLNKDTSLNYISLSKRKELESETSERIRESSKMKVKSKSLFDVTEMEEDFQSVKPLSSKDLKMAHNGNLKMPNGKLKSISTLDVQFQEFESASEIPLCAKLVSKPDKKRSTSSSGSLSLHRIPSPCSESSHVYEDMFKETSCVSDSESSSWTVMKNNSCYINGRASSMNDLDLSDSCSLSVKCDYASSEDGQSTLQSRPSSCGSSSFYVNLRDYDSHMLEPSLAKKKKGHKLSMNGKSAKNSPPMPESLRHLFSSPLNAAKVPVTEGLRNRVPSLPESHYYSTVAATSSAFKHGFEQNAQIQKPKKVERSSSIKIKDIAHGIILTFRRFQNSSKSSNVSSTHYVDVSHLAEYGSDKPKKKESQKNGVVKKNKRWRFSSENGRTDSDSGCPSSSDQRAKARRSSSDLTRSKSHFEVSTEDISPVKKEEKKKGKISKKTSNARDKGKKSSNKSSDSRVVPTVSRQIQQMADGTLYLVTTVSGDTALPGVYSDSPDTSSELSSHRPVRQTGESNC